MVSSSGSTASTLSADSSSSSNKEVQEGTFKCRVCPLTFKTVRARASHQKVHKHKPRMEHRPASSLPRMTWAPSYATYLNNARLHANLFAAHNYPGPRFVPPSLPLQTGTGLAPAQTSSAVLAPAAGGYPGNGDGGHLARQQGVPVVNQEETTTADGIDLTLKL
ncbi:hypothetical protein ZWY2020_036977 [Hordeum vulgare]|nr:hypothetical protein ZWY2020_036977 [Hordeum vulgare]